jgi:hypothetical protein
MTIVLQGQDWLRCVGQRALWCSAICPEVGGERFAISVRRTSCHHLMHFTVWLTRCFSKTKRLKTYVVKRRPVCWPHKYINTKMSIHFILFTILLNVLVWTVQRYRQTAVFGRRHSTPCGMENELIWLHRISCDSVLNAGLCETCSCPVGYHWWRTSIIRLSMTDADVYIGDVLSQLDIRRKLYFENLEECLIFNRLILDSVHRLLHGLCSPCVSWAVSTVCFMGHVHRLSHGPCPPPASWAVSTVCPMGRVHRLSHGPCPPCVSWAKFTFCLMGRAHHLSHGLCPPSRVKTTVKATKTPPFVDAVGYSPQAKHAVGPLSWALLERLVTTSEQSMSPLTGVTCVSDIWSNRTGKI